MRITGIHGSNILSFAPEPNDFKVNLSNPLTILVGPNGSGKSNVMRVVDSVIRALPIKRAQGGKRDGLLPYKSSGSNLIKAAIDIEFNEKNEKELITTFWKNALMYSNDFPGGLNVIDINCNLRQLIPKTDRILAYEQLISDSIKTNHLSPIFNGTLILELDRSIPNSLGIKYECIFNGTSFNIAMNQGYQGTIYIPKNSKEIYAQKSIPLSMIEAMDKNVRDQLANFLDGADVPLPSLPVFSFIHLLETVAPPKAINTFLAQSNVSDTLSLRKQLNALLGLDLTDQNPISLAEILIKIIQDNYVYIDDWNINEMDSGVEHLGKSNAELLSERSLPLYLLKLKNGNKFEREEFKDIRNHFFDLTRTSLDVILDKDSEVTDQEQTGYNAKIITDESIPLKYSGSGRSQVALLSALFTKHRGKVFLLDEPDSHIHPVLQTKLINEIYNNTESQFIIVTHSPYLIPKGGLEHVRYVHFPMGNLGSKISEHLPDEAISSLSIRAKRGVTPEDYMFLFSRCAAFVEGPHEAVALPVWFDKWAGEEGAAYRLGIYFHSCGGNNAVAPLMRVADLLGLTAVCLYDADIFNKQNKAVLEQLKQFGYIDGSILSEDESMIKKLSEVSSYQIFPCGNKINDDFEKLPIIKDHMEEAIKEVGYGPLAYKYIAENYDCPEELFLFFEHVKKTSNEVDIC